MLYINICKVISIPTFKLVYHCSILHYLLYIKCCTKYIIILLRTITSNKYILYIKYIYIQYSIFSIYGSMFINSCQPFEWTVITMAEKSMKRLILHSGFDSYCAINEAKSHTRENDALGGAELFISLLKGHIDE